MANKGCIKVTGNDGWVNVQTAMQEKYEDFTFQDGKTYIIQVFGSNQICILTDREPEEDEGFGRTEEPFSYTYKTGEILYAKCKFSRKHESIKINIAD